MEGINIVARGREGKSSVNRKHCAIELGREVLSARNSDLRVFWDINLIVP
jgi:hypothetical protein